MIWLIDGRSGSGKTSLADALAPSLGAVVVHMDDLYEDWSGLAAGSDYALSHIIGELAAGRPARWQQWDWARHERGAWCELPANTSVILEGCGSLTSALRELADHAVWLDCDEHVRRARAQARDGDDSWWELWRTQEDQHIAANDPRSLADDIRVCS